MRDFYFRAWHRRQKRMVYFDFSDIIHGGEVLNASFDGRYCRLNECIIMQATGLRDCNDREIYEGDILQFDVNEWGGPEDSRFVVEWDAERACFDGNGSVPDWREWCTVIANIHEHPALLMPPPDDGAATAGER